MIEVKLNKTTENPFYGMNLHLTLFQNVSKSAITNSTLDAMWKETFVNGVQSEERKQLFFSLMFSVGDIIARQHNIFKNNKIDSGGNSLRENFRTFMLWLKNNHKPQYNRFLHAHLFNEYTTFDNLLATRVLTKKKTNKVTAIIDMLGSQDEMFELAVYITKIIKGQNPFDKYLVAKYLTRPRLSKRQGHKQMLPQTSALMKKKTTFLTMVSDMCDFPYQRRVGYIHFSGYYEWRKQYIGKMESVMFSSGKITEFDQEQFVQWLDKIPATARLRVRNRVLDKTTPNPKWGDIGNWFLSWENFKKDKQSEKRVIEEKLRQRGISVDSMEASISADDDTEELLQKLKEVKKEAKVTVGANDFIKMFGEIMKGTVDEVKVEPFLDKVKLPYNTLVFADDSSSMQSTTSPEYGFSAFELASFMAAIALMKNPSDVGRSIMGLFSTDTRIIRDIRAVKRPANSLIMANAEQVRLPLYNPEISFLKNLHNIRGMMLANSTYHGTYLSSIPEKLHQWSAGDDTKIELIREFPVWTIITDGNFNNMPSPESSLNDFMYRCQQYFGFKPFVVGIDVGRYAADAKKFQGINNFMLLPPNPAQIEQFLTNFKDIDVMDVYTPLLSIFRSNRYALVRENVI